MNRFVVAGLAFSAQTDPLPSWSNGPVKVSIRHLAAKTKVRGGML